MSDRNHEQIAIDRRRAIKRDALLEVSPFDSDGGEDIGRDPRSLSPAELSATGLDRIVGLKAIRVKCLDCSGYSPAEVRKCVAVDCVLWPLRMGANPWNAKPDEGGQDINLEIASKTTIAG